MKNMSKISLDELSENPVLRTRVAKTQQLDAERLRVKFFLRHLGSKYSSLKTSLNLFSCSCQFIFIDLLFVTRIVYILS